VVRGGGAAVNKDIIRAAIIEEHQKYEREQEVSIKMQSHGKKVSHANSPFYCDTPEEAWRNYFDQLSYRLIDEFNKELKTTIEKVRK
jgi:hypothetical protein